MSKDMKSDTVERKRIYNFKAGLEIAQEGMALSCSGGGSGWELGEVSSLEEW